jgi:oligoribonuclease (3'-5' exoribonuclease)
MNVLHVAAGEVATKAGLDCGGEVVTANTRTYVPEKKAETTVTNFLKKYIPESCDEVDFTKTCLYCLTPDRHFIIDKVPLRDRVENPDLLLRVA